MMAASKDRTKEIQELLTAAVTHGASDLHLVVGQPPLLRVDGKLTELNMGSPALTADDTVGLVWSILTEEQQQKLMQDRELDLAYAIKGGTRFRINAHWERGNIGLVARVVNAQPPTMASVGLPDSVAELTRLRQGLVLVTGPTGSGKSTSLAAMIDLINQERRAHIITLEDPIEYLFTAKQSVIRQRELGRDFLSFGSALRHVVRQDPNVIMVGEMRDLETIATALTVAETGHLVFATLHTNGSAETIDRIIDVFPPHQQRQIQLQLSMELRAVISQALLPSTSGGRVAAREIMINTPAVANLIRENKVAQLKTVMQTSAQENMQTLDQDVKRLFQAGEISLETAKAYMDNPELLR